MIKIIDTKIFKKIGIIQILVGLGLIIYELNKMDMYSIVNVALGFILIISSFIYYMD